MIVVHLATYNRFDYRIGFPGGGWWREVFNSDVYENWVNRDVAGNGGSIQANGPGLNELAHSAYITVPANSILIFARDGGD